MSKSYETMSSAPMDTTLLLKQESFVYEIPSSQSSSQGWKATAWNLDKPDWTGRLRLVAREKECILRLEDKTSNKLYAECPVDAYPGPAVQSVADSSRYFVIRVHEGKSGGRLAHLGLGFADRSDSFDLNVALQDHFKSLRVEEQIQRESEEPREQLDLAFKEGQTIKVNINIPRKSGRERSKSPAAAASGVLPPPSKEMSAAVAAAGIKVDRQPRIAAPPAPSAVKQANPAWIQF